MIRNIALFALALGLSGVGLAEIAYGQKLPIPPPGPLLSGDIANQATAIPAAGPGDPRIREVMYDANQVVQIRGHLGFEMAVEFNLDERIENVSIGDSLSWQVTPNRKATMLFIKPMAKTTPTSMTVVTSQRIYTFLLIASDSKSVNDATAMLRLRFLYPPPPVVATNDRPATAVEPDVNPAAFNFDYSFNGAKPLQPARVFDDGRSTYFQFVENQDTPAVFVVGTDGKEETANTRVSGKYTIADFTTHIFVLRYGKAMLQVKNDGWREPKPMLNKPPAPKKGE